MPLDDGYGVLIGTLHSFDRDPPDDYGNYYHGFIKINTPNGISTCAIDVDTHSESVGVEYKIISLSSNDVALISSLADGYHELQSVPGTGAIDYSRSPYLLPRIPSNIKRLFKNLFMGHIVRLIEFLMLKKGYGWTSNTGDRTLDALENVINTGTVRKVYVFGEPFNDNGNLGVHNVHQNQGDPLNSQWASANGIWQDGATIFEKTDGSFTAFINKFTSQSYITDNGGNPV
ncbi:MAG: YukJ family protein [Desulfobulbaceae bacterium]|nr:YukJ family protein [Desulfobulbaceae bacterium]